MKTIQTTTAILIAIKSFGTTKFSIWDITKVIRKNLNDIVYLLDTSYQENYVYHDDVKELFLELLENGILEGVNETHNPNGYREYQFGVASPTTITPAQSTPTAVVQTAMASTNIPVDVQKKIYSYLKNNGAVTTKMIQSRLKGYPYTCKDIYEFLDKINLIDPNSKNYSDSQKFTVAI
jgi:hypothetical protein